jgi:hypothetical protein
MHFSEDDLRSALKPKDPGAAFTERVMARIEQSETKVSAPRPPWQPFRYPWWPLNLRAALAAAMVLLLAVGGWLAVARHQQVQEKAAGERARQQAILAMRIANAKLNHVLVKASERRDDKIRGEQL